MISFGLVVRAVLLAIAAMLTGAVALLVWILVYALAIEPGRDFAVYQSYAYATAYAIDLIVSVPILFGAGWLLGRRADDRIEGAKFGALVGVSYIALDLLISLLYGLSLPPLDLALTYAIKLAAAAAGGCVAGRRASPAAGPAAD